MRRRTITLPALLLCVVLAYLYVKYRPPYSFYDSLSDAEVEYSTKYPSQRKYVLFKQLQGAGFNNQAQEILLFHHLALLTSRTYVYQPFIWRHYNIQKPLPLSAFLLGPTKQAISQTVFETICTTDQVTHVNITAEWKDLWSEAQRVLRSDVRCLQVDNWIMSWSFLSSEGIQAIWPTFQPYLATHFEWPAHIKEMVDRARSELHLDPTVLGGHAYLAIHLRRGDFEGHCNTITEFKSGFTTWATLPVLKNSVFPPALDVTNRTSIIEHCYPSLRRILEEMDTQLRSRPDIRAVYILHDGAWDHLNVYHQFYKLEAALKSAEHATTVGRSGPMEVVTHSGDLPIHLGERDWKVTVDIELARKADVFIGNGYSSLSSQIVALRLADGTRPEDIDFL